MDALQFYPCLTLRSKDTIETLDKQAKKYKTQSYENLGKRIQHNVIHPCVNLQKNHTGLSGFMVEVCGDAGLQTLDTPTEQIFRGITVVKCVLSELESIELLAKQDTLQKKLDAYMTDLDTRNKAKCTVVLEQVLPSADSQDFWWFNQVCEPKKTKTVSDCILHDHSHNNVNFYDAFVCMYNSEQDTTGIDESFKDACGWDAVLNGSMGLYTQRCGDVSAFFLVCDSDFTHIASDIVRSMKSDLGNSISAFDFCDSKEMWFLEKIALRNRLRLIQQAAAHLGISIAEQPDLYAHTTQSSQLIAVPLCTSHVDHIECAEHVEAHDNAPETRVRHYRACTDVKGQKGCFPISLGDTLGYMLVFPEKISYQSFAIHNDTMPFTNNYIPGGMHLWPTINISEQSRANLDQIHAEQSTIVHKTISDIVYDMRQSNATIPPYMLELLTSTDEYANHIFYGVQYSQTSPIIIYPKIRPTFVNSTHRMPLVACAAAVKCAATTANKDVLPDSSTARGTSESLQSHIAHSGSSISMSAYVNATDKVCAGADAPAVSAVPCAPAVGSAGGPANSNDPPVTPMKDIFTFSLQSDTSTRVVDVVCSNCSFDIHETVRAQYLMSKQTSFLCFETEDMNATAAQVAVEWDEDIIHIVKKMSTTNNPKIDFLVVCPHATFSSLRYT